MDILPDDRKPTDGSTRLDDAKKRTALLRVARATDKRLARQDDRFTRAGRLRNKMVSQIPFPESQQSSSSLKMSQIAKESRTGMFDRANQCCLIIGVRRMGQPKGRREGLLRFRLAARG
jgi:hypothetical protein